jgi:hypothetical protein
MNELGLKSVNYIDCLLFLFSFLCFSKQPLVFCSASVACQCSCLILFEYIS